MVYFLYNIFYYHVARLYKAFCKNTVAQHVFINIYIKKRIFSAAAKKSFLSLSNLITLTGPNPIHTCIFCNHRYIYMIATKLFKNMRQEGKERGREKSHLVVIHFFFSKFFCKSKPYKTLKPFLTLKPKTYTLLDIFLSKQKHRFFL